jgi:alpha/beta superfamily hydrolase
MSHHAPNLEHHFLTRRQLLGRLGMGLGTMALGDLMGAGKAQAALNANNPFGVRQSHFKPTAKRVIHFFMNGGPSQVDTFDPKPMLDKYDGKQLPNVLKTERPTGAGMKSPFKFQKYGQCGLEVSEIFSRTAEFADDLCVIRSMQADVPNHEPSLGLMNTGDGRLQRPSFGSWVTYGLGSENENLPGYISMCPKGMPTRRTKNWQSAFLPSIYQGTYINTENTDVDKLVEFIKNTSLDMKQQRRQLDLLYELNHNHLIQRDKDQQLDARIQSYELAYRMQMEATDAFDISKEPEHIRKAYGENNFGRQTLIARRLLERGVRFIQLWTGAGQPWDSHDEILDHARLAKDVDGAIAAFMADMKQRGLFDDTLVLWGGEFGRTPAVELPTPGANAGKQRGRDHNHYGFTTWLAGGGTKGGYTHGATDEFGFAAVEKPVHVHELHATLLRTLGFDHSKFTFKYAGLDFRLTGVEDCKIVPELLA